MMNIESYPPAQAEGSGSITVAMYNIRSGCNGGLEYALWAMEAVGIDIGMLLETKVTNGIYMQFSGE